MACVLSCRTWDRKPLKEKGSNGDGDEDGDDDCGGGGDDGGDGGGGSSRSNRDNAATGDPTHFRAFTLPHSKFSLPLFTH